MELLCKVQNYAWGKKGSKSKVATLISNVDKDFKLNEDVPYAELWMGTHINAPSIVKETGEKLSSVISNHPEYLGEKVSNLFDGELPFLFKVLSVEKALSIQAHPSKEHAKELHAKYPDIYKDPNHKPELAIALTPFEALCGFRPIKEIRKFVEEIPELSSIVDGQNIEEDNLFLKKAFRSVLTCDKTMMAETIDNIIKRYETIDDAQRKIYLADLVVRLHEQFPYDNGILMVYFLNYMQLRPGEAIYLAANDPHAYISGDCIENMACSDNVVRAGLTPKFIDVDTLCGMLIYKGENPTDKLFNTIKEDNCTKLYKPPVPDFAVAGIEISSSTGKYQLLKRESASIVLVISGSANFNGRGILEPGRTLFLPANEVLEVTDITEDLLMYQAFANI
ncbi:mannose-6-phosphate isomerase [Anoplophora glabripennis]|nr:mannose-6-phosphate isomerase [Anoplophora glabripennis]